MVRDMKRSRNTSIGMKATPGESSSVKKAQKTAALEKAAEEIGQPEFGEPPSSKKKQVKTPSSYASSSFSPSDDPDAARFFGRGKTRDIYGLDPRAYTPMSQVSRRHRQTVSSAPKSDA